MDKQTYDKYKDTPILQRPTHIPISEVTLDDKQTKQWERMRAKLIMAAPGFTHILYKMMSRAGHKHALFTDDPQVPVAATDGVVMLLNDQRDLQVSHRASRVHHDPRDCPQHVQPPGHVPSLPHQEEDQVR